MRGFFSLSFSAKVYILHDIILFGFIHQAKRRLKHIKKQHISITHFTRLGGSRPKDYNMFFNAIPTFDFSDENVKTHALNIKKLSEWLSFKECHLCLSHCNELTAIAFGFKTLQDLKQHLNNAEFTSLKLSSNFIKDIELALKKFCPSLPFMELEDEGLELYSGTFDEIIQKELHDSGLETPLRQCQKYWGNWHSKFAIFLGKYFHEAHGNFEFLESLKLIAISNLGSDALALGNGGDQSTTFLNIAIFNHLYSQYVGDFAHYFTFNDKEVIYDNDVKKRRYFISNGLHDYLSKKENNIKFIKENLYDSNQPLFEYYDKNNQQAVLNLILCKEYIVDNHYVPTDVSNDIYTLRDKMRNITFDVKDNQFSFVLPYIYDGGWISCLDYESIEFNESDFKIAALSNSYLLEKLKGFSSNRDITCSTMAEFIFPMKLENSSVFDVTDTSFKMKDTFRVQYVFNKDVGKPFQSWIENKLNTLQAVYELIITSYVFATVEFSIIDSKITIKFSDVKTKLSPILQSNPVEVHFLGRNCSTNKYYAYDDGKLHLKISGLEKRASFKKMLDKHIYLQPYKQLIQKENCLEIYQCHQTAYLEQFLNTKISA